MGGSTISAGTERFFNMNHLYNTIRSHHRWGGREAHPCHPNPNKIQDSVTREDLLTSLLVERECADHHAGCGPERTFMVTRLPLLGVVALLAAPVLFPQYPISLHSGSIQYSSGTVLIDDQPFQKTTTNAPVVKKGERLTTGADGIPAALLTPGVLVRMVGSASFRMDEVLLSDTRVAALRGSLMVECAEMIKDNSVLFTLAGQSVE